MSGVIQGWHVPYDSPSPVEEFNSVSVIEFQDKDGDTQFATVTFDATNYGNGVVDIFVKKINPTTDNYDRKELLFDVGYRLSEEYGNGSDITIYFEQDCL